MQLEALCNDDDAVSPVIGVILMVAITVILAAVIGTFVLGLGGNLEESPPNSNIAFAFDSGASVGDADCDLTDGATSGTLTVTHEGGDSIDAARIGVTAGGGTAEWSDCSGGDSTVTAGDTAEVTVDADDTVRVVWTASGGGRSSTLATWEGS